MSIYIAFHKEYPCLTTNSTYIPIQVGRSLAPVTLPMIGDDTGENISAKNKTFNELTALYWIWKNTSDPYVGLCHYRRYFMRHNGPLIQNKLIRKTCLYPTQSVSKNNAGIGLENRLLTAAEVDSLLEKNDFIVPKAIRLQHTVEEQYQRSHSITDLYLAKQIISELAPEFIGTLDTLLSQKKLFLYNMFICRRSLFDAYMHWVFPIFTELDKRMDYSEKNAYQMRAIGFISERLFSLWLLHHQFKLKEQQLLILD